MIGGPQQQQQMARQGAQRGASLGMQRVAQAMARQGAHGGGLQGVSSSPQGVSGGGYPHNPNPGFPPGDYPQRPGGFDRAAGPWRSNIGAGLGGGGRGVSVGANIGAGHGNAQSGNIRPQRPQSGNIRRGYID